MPFWFNALVAFIYGTVVGSFLNVCIYRMPNDKSIVNPPSHCPNCNTKLRAADLIPLLSFLILGRRCRYCGTPISWRYFGIELLTGLTFIAVIWKFNPFQGQSTDLGLLVDLLMFALFSAALIAITFIDLEHWIIPDQLSLFGIGLGIIRDILGLVMHEKGHTLLQVPVPFTDVSIPMLWSVAGLFICGFIFYMIAWLGELAFKKEAMGGGDIKLAAAIGAVFCSFSTGALGLGLALLSFFIAVFVGSVIGISMKVLSRKDEEGKESYLPFGPMMVIGVMVTVFFGNFMIDWYLKYLGY